MMHRNQLVEVVSIAPDIMVLMVKWKKNISVSVNKEITLPMDVGWYENNSTFP